MKIVKIYEYENCSTCKKALRFLANRKYAVNKIDIATIPPSKAELKTMLTIYGGNIRVLFNTSGMLYQKLNMKAQVATMTPEAAIDLLSQNGRLIKRPFVLYGKEGLVGFDEAKWKKVFGDK